MSILTERMRERDRERERPVNAHVVAVSSSLFTPIPASSALPNAWRTSTHVSRTMCRSTLAPRSTWAALGFGTEAGTSILVASRRPRKRSKWTLLPGCGEVTVLPNSGAFACWGSQFAMPSCSPSFARQPRFTSFSSTASLPSKTSRARVIAPPLRQPACQLLVSCHRRQSTSRPSTTPTRSGVSPGFSVQASARTRGTQPLSASDDVGIASLPERCHTPKATAASCRGQVLHCGFAALEWNAVAEPAPVTLLISSSRAFPMATRELWQRGGLFSPHRGLAFIARGRRVLPSSRQHHRLARFFAKPAD